MRIAIAVFAAAAASLAAECPSRPTPVGLDASRPPVDGSTGAEAACTNLRTLGCIEGTAGDCAVTIDHVVATRLTRIDVGCLARAATKGEARACGGSVSCAE